MKDESECKLNHFNIAPKQSCILKGRIGVKKKTGEGERGKSSLKWVVSFDSGELRRPQRSSCAIRGGRIGRRGGRMESTAKP